MDSRLKKALETEAAQRTAAALTELVPRLETIEARLTAIEAHLKTTLPERATAAANRKDR